MSRGKALAVVLALIAALAVSPAAHAGTGPPDSDAPRGAGPQWLPQEAWVMNRWLPFDERRLYVTLRTARPTVQHWLADSNGRKSLVQLARRHGIGRRELVKRLVGKRRRGITRRQHRRLLRRTDRVVTQSHLSQHILFHTFHLWPVRVAVRHALGLSARQWRKLRGPRRGGRSGLTVMEIAKRRRVPVARLRRPVLRAVARAYRRGKRTGAISQRQVTRQMREHRWKIQYWPWPGPDHDTPGAEPSARAAHGYCEL
jgi:hypothetical protein